MTEPAFLCDGIRTPIGRYGGGLSSIRTDDLGALVLSALQERNPDVDWGKLDDVIFGCANQAGEDNRNVARMAALIAGLPDTAAGVTVNRLCGSGLESIAQAGRVITSGDGDLLIAGGVESMSRAPYVMAKIDAAFSRNVHMEDTTIGWRFVNPKIRDTFGVDPLGITAENVAEDENISRQAQDMMAFRSQQRAGKAQLKGVFAEEIIPVTVKSRKATTIIADDEHPRPEVSLEKLNTLRPVFKEGGTVTAGNASGINDGAAAMIVASTSAVKTHNLRPRARILGTAVAGVPPRVMGMGPLPASQKLMDRLGLKISDFDVIELNEAFAAQGLAVMRRLGLSDDSDIVNPNGGAIALGHPLGMSGTRIALSALHELERRDGRLALCTMCIGVGQGIAMAIERISD